MAQTAGRTGCKSARVLRPRTGTAGARSSGLAFKCAALSAASGPRPCASGAPQAPTVSTEDRPAICGAPGAGAGAAELAACAHTRHAASARAVRSMVAILCVSAKFGPLGAVWKKGVEWHPAAKHSKSSRRMLGGSVGGSRSAPPSWKGLPACKCCPEYGWARQALTEASPGC